MAERTQYGGRVTAWNRRVLVVDDDPMVTSLVGALLVNEGFTVESCGDAASARQLVEDFDPDLAILDVNLGSGPTGLQLGYVLSRLHPEIALLYLTRYPTALLTDPAMAEHVRSQAVLAKDELRDPAVLLSAIEEAFRGKGAGTEPAVAIDAGVRQLTPSQLDILALVAEGLTNGAIADKRETSERAVEKQLKRIYDILGLATNRDQNARVLAAMKYAQTLGWAGLPTTAKQADGAGLWSAESAQPRADRVNQLIDDWRDRCAEPMRAALTHLVAVGAAPRVGADDLMRALDPFVHPTAAVHRGVELMVIAAYTPPLAEVIEASIGADLDGWVTPVRGRLTRTMAAEGAFLVALGLGLVTEAWHAAGTQADLRSEARGLARALEHPARAVRLPAIRADHLDAQPVCDTGDPDLDKVLVATLECVGELGLEASTMDVIAAATGVRLEQIGGRYGTMREIFVEASDLMLSPAVQLNNAYQAEVALAHPPEIAEACMLREFMRPGRRRMRTITFEQLRLAIDDVELRRAIGEALHHRGVELAAASPGRTADEVRASLVVENAMSTGLAMVAQLRPQAWDLPFDAILAPWRRVT